MQNSKVIHFSSSAVSSLEASNKAGNSTYNNNDLVWDLTSLNYRDLAREFLLKLENNLCVYSSYVEQMYTNFEILMPKGENHKLVILPNPYAYHDTYSHIPEKAVRATGLQVVPRRGGLFLIIPFIRGAKKYRAVPLKIGLDIINKRRPSNRPLMPILMKGDLREIDQSFPTLHLHEIVVDELQHMSQLDVASIQGVIKDRLDMLLSTKFGDEFKLRNIQKNSKHSSLNARFSALTG